MKRVAINGFGRIGRIVFRALNTVYPKPKIEVVAINDLCDAHTMAHLLQYDSNYGTLNATISVEDSFLSFNGRRIKILSQSDPKLIDWGNLGVDIVLECTGVFTTKEKAKVHIERGAKKVIVSAPCDNADKTLVFGVNHSDYNPEEDQVISCASCTTNCLAPVVFCLDKEFGVVNGFMTTAHAYTNDQRILDLPHKDYRRARAANLSIIPTTTGAAKAVGKVLTTMSGKIDGLALRVPVSVVSVVDFVAVLKQRATKQEVNSAFINYSQQNLKGILGVSKEPLVSVDFKGSTLSSIVDLELTMVNENLVKVIAWYDNEFGFSCRM
ncbi:MAG: type I glyceraldehyde-3-phosphate dehydrogenase, partial [Deltaproteobacteria bacterium]|nr:type I glyceraldehyde-3-phosphate dehydrogenase [Deltaproteobacteria bacterium]